MPRAAFTAVTCAVAYAVVALIRLGAAGQLPDTYFDERSIPAVAYEMQSPQDPIAQLNAKLADGSLMLTAEPNSGYLRSALHALQIPVESQLAVFSKTSVQAHIITPANPRSLFFNDSVVVGWPAGGFIEAAAVDPQLGVMFYALDKHAPEPRFQRVQSCTSCHISLEATLSIPGMLMR